MSKSYRTCYYKRKDLWSPRPMRFWSSNKWSKTKCHRAERMLERNEIYQALQLL